MPYRSHAELPPGVKDNLTPYAQDIYREAFNRAWQEYQGASKRRGNESLEEGRPQGRLGGGEAEIREGRRSMAREGLARAPQAFRPASSQ